MALTNSSFATLLLLLSLLVIASAGGYSYDQNPDTTKPNYTDNSKSKPGTSKTNYSYDPKSKPNVVKPDLPKPNYDSNPKPYIPKPNLTVPKPDDGRPAISKPDTVKPNYGYDPKPNVPKPKLTAPKPNYGNDPKPKLTIPKPDTGKPNHEYVPKPKSTTQKPNIVKPYEKKLNLPKPKLYTPKPSNDKMDYGYSPIGIEGFVLCKQASNYTPVKGAVIRITCTAVDQYGYRKAPFSCLTEATNAKGYYFKTLPAFGLDDHLKITECKAYLESSPLETCNVPTDMNYGISGAPLSAYHILHDKKMKLYSMRTFFYTSTKPTSTPAGY